MAKKKINKKTRVKKVTAKKPVTKKAVTKKAPIKKVTSTRKRKPSKVSILKIKNSAAKLKDIADAKLRELRKKERAFIRYSFHIESIEVDKYNTLEQIVYNYKGTMVIPKSQKDNYKSGNTMVTGVYLVPKKLKDPVVNKDFKHITRKEIIALLVNNISADHKLGMQQIIEKELMPEFKIIKELPWKS